MTLPPISSSLAHLQADLLLQILLLRYISTALKCRALMDDLSWLPHWEQQSNLPVLSFPGSQQWVEAGRAAFNMEHRQWP